MKDGLGVERVACHPSDEKLFMSLKTQAMMMRFGGPMPNPPKARFNVDLADGQLVELGAIRMRVLHTPGHTPGSCCFHLEKQKVLVAGDTLFRLGAGRTDFPGGSAAALTKSLERLMKLPGDTFVVPGHNDYTTIGFEAEHNPYIRGDFWDY